MNPTLVSAPAVEPLVASDLRDHLRVEDSEAQNTLITAYIAAARGHIERRVRRRLITQTVRFTFDALEGCGLALPIGPVQSIDQVVYTAQDGTETTLAADQYALLTHDVFPLCYPAYGVTWPIARAYPGAVKVDVVVGYGDAGTDVPPELLQAIRLLTAHWYEHREDVVVGTITASIPKGVEALIAPFVFWI